MENNLKNITKDDIIVIEEKETKKSMCISFINKNLKKDDKTGEMKYTLSRQDTLKHFIEVIGLTEEAAKAYYFQEVTKKYGGKKESGRAKALEFAKAHPELNRKSMIANWEKMGIPKTTGNSYYKGVMELVDKNKTSTKEVQLKNKQSA